MELLGEFLVAHWCLRGYRTYQERNCHRGRLERNNLGISRFIQLHRNNQREKTSKAVDHSNNLVINSSPQAKSGGWKGPTTSKGWAVSSAASPVPPGQGKGRKLHCPSPCSWQGTPALVGLLLRLPEAEFLHFCYWGRVLGKDPVFT